MKMKNVEDKISMGLKVLGIGCWVLAAKAYSKVQYYQGRIDASTELNKKLQEVLHDLVEGMEQDEEEA